MNNAAPADLWQDYAGTRLFAGRTVLQWSSKGLAAPSPAYPAYVRVIVECEDCWGNGSVEREHAATYPAIEPRVTSETCDRCDGEGRYATELDDSDATKLWNELMEDDEIPVDVWRAATLGAMAAQLECDEKVALIRERSAEAAQ